MFMQYPKGKHEPSSVSRDDLRLIEETQNFLDVVLSERSVSVNLETREEIVKSMVLIMQKALLLDSKAQSDNSMAIEDNELKKMLGDSYKQVLEKREKLQEKWREMDDSDEKRDIYHLIFSDLKDLSKIELAFLSDDIEVYEKHGWREGEYWRQNLDVASLLGSRKIGEFITNKKKESLTNEDYGYILGYISSSFNGEWAIDCSKRMKEQGMTMPGSIHFFCDDFDLIQEIKQIFSAQQKNKP